MRSIIFMALARSPGVQFPISTLVAPCPPARVRYGSARRRTPGPRRDGSTVALFEGLESLGGQVRSFEEAGVCPGPLAPSELVRRTLF